MRLRTVAFAAVVISLIALTVAPFGGTDDHVPRELTAAGASYAGLNTITPERLLDTRTGIGAPVGPVGEGQTLTVPTRTRFGAFGRVDRADERHGRRTDAWWVPHCVPGRWQRARDVEHQHARGQTVPNLVAVRLGGGAVSFYNAFGTTHVLADVTAYAWRTATSSASLRGGCSTGGRPRGVWAGRSGCLARSRCPRPLRRSDVGRRGGGVERDCGSADRAELHHGVADRRRDAECVEPQHPDRSDRREPHLRTGRCRRSRLFFDERGKTHLLADVAGYVPVGAAYVPLVPTRASWTRGSDSVGARWWARIEMRSST